jgi:DNA-directed RNA polymerase alpha subunit
MNKQNLIDTLNNIQGQLGRLSNNIRLEYDSEGGKIRLISSYPHIATPKVLESLASDGITTVGKLAHFTEEEILKIPGIGRKSARKLSTLLECHGHSFKK